MQPFMVSPDIMECIGFISLTPNGVITPLTPELAKLKFVDR